MNNYTNGFYQVESLRAGKEMDIVLGRIGFIEKLLKNLEDELANLQQRGQSISRTKYLIQVNRYKLNRQQAKLENMRMYTDEISDCANVAEYVDASVAYARAYKRPAPVAMPCGVFDVLRRAVFGYQR